MPGTSTESCAYLQLAGRAAARQAGVKLDLKRLHLAQDQAVGELLKLALPLTSALTTVEEVKLAVLPVQLNLREFFAQLGTSSPACIPRLTTMHILWLSPISPKPAGGRLAATNLLVLNRRRPDFGTCAAQVCHTPEHNKEPACWCAGFEAI